MALSKSYYSIEGEILGERDGLGRRNYASDALGSVAGTTSTGSLTGSSVYSPYGRSGSVSSGFGWNGSSGYYTTGRTYASQYVRARHYDSRNGRWNTVDPLWPSEEAYVYATESPVTGVDPSGRQRRRSVRFESSCDQPIGPSVQKNLDRLNHTRDSRDQLTIAMLSEVIREDECCQQLILKSSANQGGTLAMALVENGSYLAAAAWCMMCQETGGFQPRDCTGVHHDAPLAAGLFGFFETFWEDYADEGTNRLEVVGNSLREQVRVGVRALCWRLCKGNGGCNCSGMWKGKATSAKADMKGRPWPNNIWPYLPGKGSRQHSDWFSQCMAALGYDSNKPPWISGTSAAQSKKPGAVQRGSPNR